MEDCDSSANIAREWATKPVVVVESLPRSEVDLHPPSGASKCVPVGTSNGDWVSMYNAIDQLAIMAAQVKDFLIWDCEGNMFEGDLRHLGGKECCSYFMSFESVGNGRKDGRCVCALLQQ